VRFAFIHAEKACFPLTPLCKLLGVSRQGYHQHISRPRGPRATEDDQLRELILEIFVGSGQRYGSPRIHRALRDRGVRVGKARVEKLMRELGLKVRSHRSFRVNTTTPNAAHATVPNVLNREFTADAPNQRWVTDITYLMTDEAPCFLTVILDLYSRAVVGWAIETTLSTAGPLRALEMALVRRCPEPGLLHHSDRGCQYTSLDYRDALKARGIEVSMSRKGNCWDNAVAESFFATIKTELIRGRRWPNLRELHAAVFEYIEVFYNRQRLHSTLGYKAPAQVELEYALTKVA
jgi:transposase InsO family protein